MTSIKPKSVVATHTHVAELAAKASAPSDPAKEAALAAAVLSMGPDATALSARALGQLGGLDEGLRAKATLMALTTAYGPELTTLVFKSGNVADFAARLRSVADDPFDPREIEAANRFLAGFEADKALLARDGRELPLWTIAEAKVHAAGSYPSTRSAELRGPSASAPPVETSPNHGWVSFSDDAFGLARLANGTWTAWLQNDWNRDLVPLESLSSASLLTIREHLADRRELRGLSGQLDKLLEPRLSAAALREFSYRSSFAELNLDRLASGTPVEPSALMMLPSVVRVARHDESWLKAVVRQLRPNQTHVGSPRPIGDLPNQHLHVGLEYASSLHASQPLAADGAHLQWLKSGSSETGGLVELASGKFRFFQYDLERRQGSFPATNYFELEQLDRGSLEKLRTLAAGLVPASAEDVVMRTARQAHPYGAAFTRLLGQLDAALAKSSP
jgi:hypothetical protein